MSSNYHRSREPWYRRWFGRHERTEDEGLGSNALQSNFNFAALATLLLPLLFLLIARIVIRDGENWWNWDMDGDGEGWWNGEWDREKWQGIATWLTLLLSLLVFFGIVYQGNYVLGRRTNDRNLKPLVAALFVFALMSLALAIMFSAFGVSSCLRCEWSSFLRFLNLTLDTFCFL